MIRITCKFRWIGKYGWFRWMLSEDQTVWFGVGGLMDLPVVRTSQGLYEEIPIALMDGNVIA